MVTICNPSYSAVHSIHCLPIGNSTMVLSTLAERMEHINITSFYQLREVIFMRKWGLISQNGHLSHKHLHTFHFIWFSWTQSHSMSRQCETDFTSQVMFFNYHPPPILPHCEIQVLNLWQISMTGPLQLRSHLLYSDLAYFICNLMVTLRMLVLLP